MSDTSATQVNVIPSKEQLAKLFAEPKALISVYDKTGIGKFAAALTKLGIGIVSTGSTAHTIETAGVPVTPVEQITGVPEMLDGRVKTLHPIIHAGILANTGRAVHVDTVLKRHIPYFQIVCVDMYPFEAAAKQPGAGAEDINELIDIGGPTMLRGAAKARRIVLCHPSQRSVVLQWLEAGRPNEAAFLDELAARVFYETARYDLEVARHLDNQSMGGLIAKRFSPVKYGENVWQTPAALYADNRIAVDPLGIDQFEFLESLEDGAEKFEKGYVGITDLDRLLQTATHIAAGFERNFGKVPLMAIGVKHGNPCGAAVVPRPADPAEVGRALVTATEKMLEGDTRAIHGGVVLLSGVVDKNVAETLMHYANEGSANRLLDGIVAVGFSTEARQILSRAKLRLIQNPALAELGEHSLDTSDIIRPVRGGFLKQPNYMFVQDFKHQQMEFLGPKLSLQARRDMILAWAVGSTSNDNTVTITKDGALVGNGVGQQDRVGAGQLALTRSTTSVPAVRTDSRHVTLAVQLNKAKLEGAVAYSDSFFPFPDGPELLVNGGIGAILSSFASEHHKEILEPLVKKGVSFALMPDNLSRGFARH